MFVSQMSDMLPDMRRSFLMKNIVLAAFAALSLTAVLAPAALAFTQGSPHTTYHQGPYDNTGNSTAGYYAEGGDGN
jgi:hypothetical protein